MPTPQCITISLALAEPRHLRSSTHCSRMPSAVPRHPAWISAIAPFCGAVRYTGIQSATVTVRSTPRSVVACPSMPSRTSHPSGSDSCQCTSVPWTWCASTVTGKRAPNAARNARHRPITWPTGSSLHSPRLSGRVVTPATTPYRSAHSANSSRGTAASPAETSAREGTGAACCAPTSFAPALSAPLNLRPQRFQPVVDVLVTPFDLPDVVDDRIALGREGRQQHRHTGADVGTFDRLPAQGRRPCDHGAILIAEHDARTHADQFVYEKQPRLEELLEHEQEPFALRGHDDGDGHEVGGKRGPRSVFELGDVAAEVGADPALLTRVNDQFVSSEPRPDTEPLERQQGGPQVVAAHAVDRNRTAGDRGQSDERADLDVIGTDGVRRSRERRSALDRECVAADAVDGGAERNEKPREVLDVRLRRRVAQHRGAGRPHGSHQRVLGPRDARLVEKDVGAGELPLELVGVADSDGGAEPFERQEVRIDAPAADDVAARRRQRDASEARQHRPGKQDRGADLLAQGRIEGPRLGATRVYFDRVLPVPLDRRADVLQQGEQGFDVANAWHVVDAARAVGEESGRENGKGRVFVAGGPDRAREGAPPRDTERRWHRFAQGTGALAPASSVRERWPSCIP